MAVARVLTNRRTEGAAGAAADPRTEKGPAGARSKTSWLGTLPFLAVHAMALGVLWVGWSPVAVAVALALFWARMFAVTGFYHRYFSHRTFKTSRWFQFVAAVWASAAVQKGPLWWAAHHRHHHRHADGEEDLHSPVRHGFLYSHLGWIFAPRNSETRLHLVPDLARFRELRWLDRFDLVVPVCLGVAVFALGAALERTWPELGTNGWQMLVWGFFVSTLALSHATFTINSLSHRFGRRRFQTTDTSRNNWLLALVTMGEGWHNNHHHYATAARQGFYWWEVDLTYYGLWLLARLGLIWDLKPVPAEVLAAGRARTAERREAARLAQNP